MYVKCMQTLYVKMSVTGTEINTKYNTISVSCDFFLHSGVTLWWGEFTQGWGDFTRNH